MPYTYEQGTDGTEAKLYILKPDGDEIAQIAFWDDEPKDVDAAKRNAQQIVGALNDKDKNESEIERMNGVVREWELDMKGTMATLERERAEKAKLLEALVAVKDAGYIEGGYQPTVDMVDAAIAQAEGSAA
jgi:hypothetical protein